MHEVSLHPSVDQYTLAGEAGGGTTGCFHVRTIRVTVTFVLCCFGAFSCRGSGSLARVPLFSFLVYMITLMITITDACYERGALTIVDFSEVPQFGS